MDAILLSFLVPGAATSDRPYSDHPCLAQLLEEELFTAIDIVVSKSVWNLDYSQKLASLGSYTVIIVRTVLFYSNFFLIPHSR